VVNEAAKSNPADLESFLAQKLSKDPSMTIEDYRTTIVQAIGENIQVKRVITFEKAPNKSFGVYSHLGGKIVTVVEIEGSDQAEQVAKDVAMHAAATAPEYLSPEKVPSEIVEREKDVARGQVEGKPANIIDKIIEGKLRAFYDQICLLNQKFIKDDSVTVAQFVEKNAKESGSPLKVVNFLRWNIGEG